MIYTLENIYKESIKNNPVKISRIIGGTKWRKYKLLETIKIELSNGILIQIPKGFEWDLSSVPRIFWSILPPDGNFIIAALIHDYLYGYYPVLLFFLEIENPRKFADVEMLKWSKAMNSTKKISIKNVDNYLRFYGVRIGGRKAWETIE